MSDKELVKRLRGRTTKKLFNDWHVGRDCPECGSMADRPKCLLDYGPSCPRHDPDAYDPPAWDHVADKDCAEAADRIEALTAERDALKQIAADHVLQELEQAARADKAEAKLTKAVEGLQAFKAFDEMPTRYKRPDVFEVSVRRKLLSTLAEIEGEKR
jgi:hypothetical protein